MKHLIASTTLVGLLGLGCSGFGNKAFTEIDHDTIYLSTRDNSGTIEYFCPGLNPEDCFNTKNISAVCITNSEGKYAEAIDPQLPQHVNTCIRTSNPALLNVESKKRFQRLYSLARVTEAIQTVDQ